MFFFDDKENVKSLLEKEQYLDDLYIYYLELDSDLPSDYIFLAATLKSYGITLVPVKASEIDYFVKLGSVPLLAITDTIERNRRFKKCRREYLDFALRNQAIQLFHLNSFTRVTGFEQLEKIKVYNQLPLPMNLDDLFSIIVEVAFSREEKEKKWPGGKRVGLPQVKG